MRGDLEVLHDSRRHHHKDLTRAGECRTVVVMTPAELLADKIIFRFTPKEQAEIATELACYGSAAIELVTRRCQFQKEMRNEAVAKAKALKGGA